MKQILCFGDSNTYGLIPKSLEHYERYGWGVRWSSILDERIRKYGYRVIEEGLCGRTTIFDDLRRNGRNGSKMLPVLLETHNPIEMVVLMLGTNDCKAAYGATPERIGQGVEKLLDQVEAFDPNIRILLMSPIALGEGVFEEGYDPEFNADSVAVSKALPSVYERIARQRGIDFLAASDYVKPSNADREHMNAEGHRRFAEAVVEKMESMIAYETVKSKKIALYEEYVS